MFCVFSLLFVSQKGERDLKESRDCRPWKWTSNIWREQILASSPKYGCKAKANNGGMYIIIVLLDIWLMMGEQSFCYCQDCVGYSSISI